MTLSLSGRQRPLVLVGAGAAAAVAALQAEAGPPLALALDLPWGKPLAIEQPPQSLASLAEQGPGLVPLPLDPGLVLQGFGHWAEALGAWRQPVLLLVPPAASAGAAAGAARAYHALLQAAGVPLLGLVQVQGTWQPEQRRCDGLPWLGWLAPEGDPEPHVALRAAATARWRAVSAARPDPSPCCPPVAADPRP
mgnify:CR=1 FL=1